MLNVRLAGDHLYGKWLFTWLSLVMSLKVSFCAVLFPRDVFDEIWDLIESVLPTLSAHIRNCFHKQQFSYIQHGFSNRAFQFK